MSIGSPIETAEKLNAMQRSSALPLVIGTDYEYGAGRRQRGGYFLPNDICLGGATVFPPQMALGATRDTGRRSGARWRRADLRASPDQHSAPVAFRRGTRSIDRTPERTLVRRRSRRRDARP